MKKFYYVLEWSARHIPIEHALISAGSSWFVRQKRFMKWVLSNETKSVFIDSGGFTFFKKWNEYPFSMDEYLDFINSIRDNHTVSHIATLDYPCEPEIKRKSDESNESRIQRTVDNAVLCFDSDPSLEWIPVIQGYTLNEYLHCIDLYDERGIDADIFAIGSICQRDDLESTALVIDRIKQRINRNLHGFGISLSILKSLKVWNLLYSADSASWQFGKFAKGPLPSNRDEKIQGYRDYKQKIDALFETYENQTKLVEFI